MNDGHGGMIGPATTSNVIMIQEEAQNSLPRIGGQGFYAHGRSEQPVAR
jgi:hypothetical protein